MTDGCRTPGKLSFQTRAEARTVARNMHRGGLKGQLRPYRCSCGFWHLTRMPRRIARRINKTRVAA